MTKNTRADSALLPTHPSMRDGFPIYYWQPGENCRPLKEGWNYFPNGNKILWWGMELSSGYEEIKKCKVNETKVNFVIRVLQSDMRR